MRLQFYKDAIEIIRDNWLTGVGRGGWKALVHGAQDYYYDVTFVHDNYLEIFIEAGILGFAANLILSGLALFSAAKQYFKTTDITSRILLSGLFCGLLAILAHSIIDIDMSFFSIQMLVWLMFAGAAQYKEAEFISSKSLKTISLIVSAAILSVSLLYFTANYNGQRALSYMEQKNYKGAMVYYEEASRLDPHNSLYLSERAKLYNYFAETESESENKQNWLVKARDAAEKSTKEFKHYPFYIDIMIRAYLASNMPLEALEKAEELVSFQKYRLENYELLAQSYIAASDRYLMEGNKEKAEELLLKCIDIPKNQYFLKAERSEYSEYIEKKVKDPKHKSTVPEYIQEALMKW
jgi:tetratricopeptide (TPR) repeat protein